MIKLLLLAVVPFMTEHRNVTPKTEVSTNFYGSVTGIVDNAYIQAHGGGGGGGVDTNAVRDIAREEITPATNSLYTTLNGSIDIKRDKDDLAVYEKIGIGDWNISVTPPMHSGERILIEFDEDLKAWRLLCYDANDTVFGSGYCYDAKSTDFMIPSTKLYMSRQEGITEEAIFTATRSYKLDPVSPADSLAKVSQIADKIGKDGGTVGYISEDYSKIFRGLDLLKFVDDWSGEGKTLREILSGFIRKGNELEYVNDTKYGDLSVVGTIYIPTWSSLIGGEGSLPDYLDSLAWRTTGDRTLSDYGITNAVPLSMISETDPTFSNAVLAVQISTNDFAALYALKEAFADLPIDPVTGGISIGALLAALASAVAWLKKNKVGSFESVGGATATVKNGVAELNDFFTESNSLLTSRVNNLIDAKVGDVNAVLAAALDGTEVA